MNLINFLYKNCFKPVVFRLDPEFIHDSVSFLGKLLGKFSFSRQITKLIFCFENKSLEQNLLGIHFKNPVGLAAGFDKNAELTDILPSVGFGFEEVGSITGEYCEGNPKPRLWRIVKNKSLLVYYGLKNDGSERIAKRLEKKKFLFPLGISIAKTNSPKTVERSQGITDYVKAYKEMNNIGDYLTINISCPNAFGGEPFADKESLEELLIAIEKEKITKPIFIKLTPDLTHVQIDELLNVINNHKISGIICSNLTKKHELLGDLKNSFPSYGGLSGKIQEELSNKQLAYVYKQTQGKYVLIGCGGIFSAEDAYKKIKLGASLVQLITGMIFEGPQVIGEINRGLVKLLQQDGYKNISEAVGKDVK